jgi:hypothetical protein
MRQIGVPDSDGGSSHPIGAVVSRAHCLRRLTTGSGKVLARNTPTGRFQFGAATVVEISLSAKAQPLRLNPFRICRTLPGTVILSNGSAGSHARQNVGSIREFGQVSLSRCRSRNFRYFDVECLPMGRKKEDMATSLYEDIDRKRHDNKFPSI